MISGLWQCADPTWWEHLLSFPLSVYGLLASRAGATVLKRSGHKDAARVARLACLWQAGSMVLITTLGVTAGIVLNVLDQDPSFAFKAARLTWLLAGWPVVLSVTAAHRHALRAEFDQYPGPDPELPDATTLRRYLSLGVYVTMAVAIVVWRNATIWPVAVPRKIVEGILDLETAPLATNECLAERTIAYLNQASLERIPGDPASAIGSSASWALNRPRHPTPDEAVTAMRSYRTKLARGEYYPPKSYRGVESMLTRFRRDPKLLDELEAWRLDEDLPWDVRTRAAWLKCCHR